MAAGPAEWHLRPYRPEDCAELARLCRDTVQAVCRADYTAGELDAWVSGVSPEAWAPTLAAHETWVAQSGNLLICFADLTDGGYLDRLYVHRDFQGRGVATALCDLLESRSAVPTMTVHASRTALPFFLHRGYRLVRPNQVLRRGVTLENFLLEKPLSE